jgi:transcriptional regulator with XRE-family HTH domain
MSIIVRGLKVIISVKEIRVSAFNSSLIALGRRIRAARKCKGWTQEELADESGLDRSYVGGIERGERNISIKSLCQIAKALKYDIAFFTKGIPKANND